MYVCFRVGWARGAGHVMGGLGGPLSMAFIPPSAHMHEGSGNGGPGDSDFRRQR